MVIHLVLVAIFQARDLLPPSNFLGMVRYLEMARTSLRNGWQPRNGTLGQLRVKGEPRRVETG